MVVYDNAIAKSAIGLRGFIGALKNGQSTMAAFNAEAGLNPFTIIAVIATVVGALVFLLVQSSISLDRHGTRMGRSSWLVQRRFGAIGQVVKGLLV